MNHKSVAQAPTGAKSIFAERLKWAVVFILVVAGIIANYYFSHKLSLPIRLSGWLILALIAASVAATTVKGKKTIAFMQDARIELRKVVWPTRQETIQTTLIVVVIVTIAAVILWLLDSLLLWVINLIT